MITPLSVDIWISMLIISKSNKTSCMEEMMRKKMLKNDQFEVADGKICENVLTQQCVRMWENLRSENVWECVKRYMTEGEIISDNLEKSTLY